MNLLWALYQVLFQSLFTSHFKSSCKGTENSLYNRNLTMEFFKGNSLRFKNNGILPRCTATRSNLVPILRRSYREIGSYGWFAKPFEYLEVCTPINGGEHSVRHVFNKVQIQSFLIMNSELRQSSRHSVFVGEMPPKAVR